MNTLQDFFIKCDQINQKPQRIKCYDGYEFDLISTYGVNPNAQIVWYVQIKNVPTLEPLIYSYADELDSIPQTQYSYVPIDLVEQIIKDHGGINIVATFESVFV